MVLEEQEQSEIERGSIMRPNASYGRREGRKPVLRHLRLAVDAHEEHKGEDAGVERYL